MGMSVGSPDGDDEVMSAINTTPLVDVMLVLLIIFLITIPVVTAEVKLTLPKISNEALIKKPEDITVWINAKGDVFWNARRVGYDSLVSRMKEVAVMVPQPEIHIRADSEVRFEFVGRVQAAAQRAGILKIGFITDPVLRDVTF